MSRTDAPLAPPESEPRLRRLALLTLFFFLLGLLPWIGYLAMSLPVRHRSDHWDLVWVGFDLVLVAAVATTLICLRQRSAYLPLAATALGTLLLADAWFDCSTAGAGSELNEALAWLIAEPPLAAFSFLLAVTALRNPQLISSIVAQVERGGSSRLNS